MIEPLSRAQLSTPDYDHLPLAPVIRAAVDQLPIGQCAAVQAREECRRANS